VKDKPLFFEGKSNTFLIDYQLDYQFSHNLRLSAVLNDTYINAEGSNIGNNNRNTLAAVLLLNHQVTKKWSYGINLRQEFLNDFDNPFLLAFDGKYKATPWYTVKFNASKNYRVPTFNDLYWDVGGNSALEPETSHQAEIGNIFYWNNVQFKLNGFFIASSNLIKWQPSDSGLWMPENISETENYGLEVSGNYLINFKEHLIRCNVNYSYTSATDLEKDKQLIYVPFHKITGLINYNFKHLSAYYQILYNGKVFTTTNNTEIVAAYSVSNLGLEYEINTNSIPVKIGFKINNIFDKYYENIAYRPMPNKNYQIFLNFKF